MICSCPKCDANIDIDLSRVPSAGHYTPCPSCKSRFWAQQETFINRAFKKEGKIYCVNCDNELGTSHVCSHCSTLLPDYCLIQKTKPPQRKKETNFSLSLGFSSGGGRSVSHVSSRSASSSRSNAFTLKIAVFALIIIGLAAGVFFYKKSQEESLYVVNYVRAMYGVKSGVDKSLSMVTKMRDNVGYAMTSQDVNSINIAKAEIDNRMSLIVKTPDKFSVLHDKIISLYSIYNKLYALTTSPAGGTYAQAMTIEAEFNKAALDLKSALTAEIQNELKNSSVKYKNMDIFLN